MFSLNNINNFFKSNSIASLFKFVTLVGSIIIVLCLISTFQLNKEFNEQPVIYTGLYNHQMALKNMNYPICSTLSDEYERITKEERQGLQKIQEYQTLMDEDNLACGRIRVGVFRK